MGNIWQETNGRPLKGLSFLSIDLSMSLWDCYLFGCQWMTIVHHLCWSFWISYIGDFNLRVISTLPLYFSSSLLVFQWNFIYLSKRISKSCKGYTNKIPLDFNPWTCVVPTDPLEDVSIFRSLVYARWFYILSSLDSCGVRPWVDFR